MKTYTIIRNENNVPSYNYVLPNGSFISIPPEPKNMDYVKMLEEVEAGEAELVEA